MLKVIHFTLLALLTAVPMGWSGLSSCDVGALLSVDAHHHEGLTSSSPCTISDESHHDESEVPCGEDCSIELPDAVLLQSGLRAPSAPFTALAKWNSLAQLDALTAADHATPRYCPPDGARRAPSPVFTTCFRI